MTLALFCAAVAWGLAVLFLVTELLGSLCCPPPGAGFWHRIS